MLYTLLTTTATAPSKAYADDAGFDLYCDADLVIEPSSFVDVPLGVAIKVPAPRRNRYPRHTSTHKI